MRPDRLLASPPPRRLFKLGRLALAGLVLLTLAVGLLYGSVRNPAATATAVLTVFTCPALLVAVMTLKRQVYAWRTPEAAKLVRFRLPRTPQYSFSLLVPARFEETVLEYTLGQLVGLNYEDYEIVVVVSLDDAGTYGIAEKFQKAYPGLVKLAIDTHPAEQKNKPKALNTGLTLCTNAVIGVVDAESKVASDLLRYVDAALLANPRAGVVQGGVQLMNYDTSWWALRNVLEYYFWFKSRLHFQADKRFIPLGGNTVFIKRQLLLDPAINGWDPDCLTEDCKLGVELSVRGVEVVSFYDPALATQEETPKTLRKLIFQRVRWNSGFIKVLLEGSWRRLPTRHQRLLAFDTLAMPFFQAIAGMMIPVSAVTMVFLKAPTMAVLWAFLPLIPTVLTLVVERAALKEFCEAYGFKVKVRDDLRLVAGAIPYQVALAVAAILAVRKTIKRDNTWVQTEHQATHYQLGARASHTREQVG
jgi:cellulose synthase/poly-beta-1,6-N-acetylglucosamine synthase-like glycosyltransferase